MDNKPLVTGMLLNTLHFTKGPISGAGNQYEFLTNRNHGPATKNGKQQLSHGIPWLCVCLPLSAHLSAFEQSKNSPAPLAVL